MAGDRTFGRFRDVELRPAAYVPQVDDVARFRIEGVVDIVFEAAYPDESVYYKNISRVTPAP